MNYQDLQKRVQLAKEAGYSEADINAAIARKAGIQQQNYSQPQAAPKSGLGSVASAIGKFFAPQVSSIVQDVSASSKIGDYESSMGNRAKRLVELSQAIKNEKDPIRKMALVNESRALANGDRPKAPNFSSQTLKAAEAGKTGTIGDYAGRGIKTGLEVGSYLIPVGKGVKAATGLGAAGGVVRGLSAEDATAQSVLTSGLTGAAVGGTLALVGKGYNLLKNSGGGIKRGVEEKAAMSITKASPSQFDRIVQDKGVDLNKLVSKYYPGGSNYDDLLGPVAQRGRGGILGSTMQEAEDVIQETIKTAGSNYRIPVDDVVASLKSELAQLKRIPGNKSSVTALSEFITQTQKLYKNGLTPKQLLNIKRVADSKFGQAVIDETTGSVAAQGQKTLANWSRSLLKKLFPEIKDSLETQSDMYILQPVLNRARSIMKTQGSKIRTGAFQNATDFLNPKAYYDAAMSNPSWASRFLNKGNIPATPGNAFTQNLFANPVATTIKDAGGTLLRNLPVQTAVGLSIGSGNPPQKQNSTQTQYGTENYNKSNYGYGNANQSNEIMAQPTGAGQGLGNKPSDVFGGRTKQQVLTEALAQGAKPSDLKSINDVYDMVSGGTDKPLSGTQTNQVNLAKSGLRGLTKAEQILGIRDAQGNELADGSVDMSVLTKQLVPGQLMSRDYDAAAFAATEALLRARSGAAVPETEVRRYQRKLFPSFGDSEAVVKQKLTELRAIFGDMMNQRGAGVDPTELGISSPSNQFGGSY